MTPAPPLVEAGEVERVLRFCRERRDGYGALDQSAPTAIALSRAIILIERLDAARTANETGKGE